MKKIKCNVCNKELSKKARICPYCGTNTNYKTRVAIPFIIIIAIILIIFLIVFVYKTFSKHLYTGVNYSYSTSTNEYAYTYIYLFETDNTYKQTIIESDTKAITEERQHNNDTKSLLEKYSKTTLINGKYVIDKNKIFLQENDTSKNYECDIVSYHKIRCNNITYSFDRKEVSEEIKYLK
jgi:predicted nucleic acid-binding Zn ribbon protein